MSLACIIVAGGKRTELLDTVILPKVAQVGFDDVLVVGTHHPGEGYRHLDVPPLTQTTNDALVKRDVGALATDCDLLWYLSDDHYPVCYGPNDLHTSDWDVIVPCRWTERDGQVIPLTNGEAEAYCGGHGMVIRRSVVQQQPWCLGPFHPNWDLLISRRHQAAGVRYRYHQSAINIFDVEPGATPWA